MKRHLIFCCLLLCFFFCCKKKTQDTSVSVTIWNTFENKGIVNSKVVLKERNNSYGTFGTGGVTVRENVIEEGQTDAEGNFYFANLKARQNVKRKENFVYVVSLTEMYGKTISQSAVGGEEVQKGITQNIRIPILVYGKLNFQIINNPVQGGVDTIQVIFKNPYDHQMYPGGIVYQTSYGNSIYFPSQRPAGPYSVIIKKYKSGVYSEQFDSIYINRDQTTNYQIIF